MKKLLYISLALIMPMAIAACGKKTEGVDVPDSNRFTYWIPSNDSQGTYYEKYEDNMAIQWLNNQYWDLNNHTLGDEKNGERAELSFAVPVAGAERDNFNTMLATGEYPEIIDLSFSDVSARKLCEDGILLEITEYVEKYMPNYLAFFEQFPDLKKFACETDENGKDHWYQLMEISDIPEFPWGGYGYRRDWVVKYAVPTDYVWDWESDYVKTNGHPAVTPLSEAQTQGNLEGWKKNGVTAFTAEDGDDPNNTYTDNVIFPSGKSDPYTISDWEWMFEAFSKAIKERGFGSNSNAYCTTLYYAGYFQPGDIVSSFGGANGGWYIRDGRVEFSGATDNFKTYVECMNNWYKNGWLDTKFETRSSDMFFEINATGFNQGMVGLTYEQVWMVGSTIRATCINEDDKRDAMVFGCSLPVNDVYGTDAQKYKIPDSFYQTLRVSYPLGITTKGGNKNREALFSMLNWMYSPEGDYWAACGLSEEQYKSMKFEPDLYPGLGITSGYTHKTGTDGGDVVALTVPVANSAINAIRPNRIGSRYLYVRGNKTDYGYPVTTKRAIDNWMAYMSTAGTLNYVDFLSDEEVQLYTKTNNYIFDYMAQTLPQMIKGGLGDWDNYVKKIGKFAPDKVSNIFQQYVD